MINYVTQTLFVACPTGIYSLDIGLISESDFHTITSLYVSAYGKPVKFPSVTELGLRGEACLQFTTFTKKSGYLENLRDCMPFLQNPEEKLMYDAPGGPTRPFYLSSLNNAAKQIGFILANGEKITEWIHWLSVARFSVNAHGSPALKIFEVSIDRPWTKESILMSTLPDYSVLQNHRESGTVILDLPRLARHKNPSQYRGMLVVTPYDNEPVVNLMLQSG